MLVHALPAAGRAAESDLVEYALTAAPLPFSPVSGIRFDGFGYNGSIPGPLLRVVHGQRMRVKYVNRTGLNTAVHWHGMSLPNDMDGAAGVTQPPVEDGGTFTYEFVPGPPGTRWYHDHGMGVTMGLMRGLFGMIVVEDPKDERADAEFVVVLHDVPSMNSVMAALKGTSDAPMVDPEKAPEVRLMQPDDKMGDEVSYVAHCINGASYPKVKPMPVQVGQRVRLRVLNANPTQTRYLRLAGHRLRVTHADGNPLKQPLEVDALRVGVGERYDAWFEVTKPGAWLLQAISADPLAFEQAVVVHTPGMEKASPQGSSSSLDGVEYFTYEKAGNAGGIAYKIDFGPHSYDFTLDGGEYGSSRWTMNGKVWPNTEKLMVSRGDLVWVNFTNKTDMHHPMHLHGHTFEIAQINGQWLERPLAKDIALVDPHGGMLRWRFTADSPPGRWLLHCHNDIHMMDGMMTEVVYK